MGRLSIRGVMNLKQNFRFTGDRCLEADFFQKSVLKSVYFRRDTISMLVSLCFGAITLSIYWSMIPISSRILLIVILLCLPSVWLRTIADHVKVRKELEQMRIVDIPNELLVRASGVSFVGPSLFYAITLLFFLSLGFTIHSYEHVLSTVSRWMVGRRNYRPCPDLFHSPHHRLLVAWR